MAAIVIDASAAAPWFLPDEASEQSDYFYKQVVSSQGLYHAPALWIWETGNILMSALRRKRVSPEQLQAGLAQLQACPISFAPVPSAHKQSQILRLAQTHDLSYYDASYLELVLSLNGQLASADSKLVHAAKSCGVLCIDL
jgi:predicted nucleic acid-binding protein